MEALPEECQYLTPDHQQEKDQAILKIHLETLLLLSTRGGLVSKMLVRKRGTYPIIRELHLQVDDDEGVRRGCERLVNVIMSDDGTHGTVARARDGAPGRSAGVGTATMKGRDDVGRMVTQADIEQEDDEDDEIVPMF